MTCGVQFKAPSEDLDYKVVWDDLFQSENDYITGFTFENDAGITVDRDDFDNTSSTLWVAGGTENEDYEVTFKVSTFEGRKGSYVLTVKIRTRPY